MLIHPPRGSLGPRWAPLVEHGTEDVLQIGFCPATGLLAGSITTTGLALGVMTIGLLRRTSLSSGINLTPVELAALQNIGEEFVGGRDGFEPLFRLEIARIQVGMVPLGQIAVGAAMPMA